MHMWLAVAAGLAVTPPPEAKTCPNGAIVPLTESCPVPAFIDPFIVFFDLDSADLTPATAAILDNAVAAWRQIPGFSVTLAGHADQSGAANDNLVLSQRRANRVRAYLIREGIPGGSITTEALGESRPLVETGDGVREPQNRRVEISFGPGASR
jgi:outer membrane protein OmpA-like peptidoglycan-associated protein